MIAESVDSAIDYAINTLILARRELKRKVWVVWVKSDGRKLLFEVLGDREILNRIQLHLRLKFMFLAQATAVIEVKNRNDNTRFWSY